MESLIQIRRVMAPYLGVRLARTERGASLVEYALLVGLIAIVCLIAIAFLGTSTSTRFSYIGSNVAGS